MRVAFATCTLLPEGWPDDSSAARLLGAEFHPWDDETVDWTRFDRVLPRAVYDYSRRLGEFLAWCDDVGPERLRNAPELVRFNADKRYLGELETPTVPTTFVTPGEPVPELDGEVVVKPNVSAGARNTGRFGPTAHAQALDLIAEIHATGRVALVQQYLASVDERGETALVYFGGELSHVLRKGTILSPDEVAPRAQEGLPKALGLAQVMLNPELVGAGEADAAEREVGRQALAEITSRFGTPVLLRVDLVHDDRGEPVIMELEAIEPVLYFRTAPGSVEAFAAAVRSS